MEQLTLIDMLLERGELDATTAELHYGQHSPQTALAREREEWNRAEESLQRDLDNAKEEVEELRRQLGDIEGRLQQHFRAEGKSERQAFKLARHLCRETD